MELGHIDEKPYSCCWCERLHDAFAHHRVVLPGSCLEQGSSALAEDLALGLEHGRINLAILVDNVDGGASGVGKVDALLGAHVPPHLDILGL